MGGDGWVKLYRKTMKSDMYRNLNAVQRDVMINCLMRANHSPKKWEWKGEIIELNPGQFKTSLASLKEVCAKDVSTQNIRTALKKLEKWGFLTNKSTKSGRVITIVNWGKYQGKDNETNKATNKQVTKNQQRTNKELTTNKNVKNDKNVKNVKKSSNNIMPEKEIEKIYNSLSGEKEILLKDYIEVYRQNNKSKKITTGRHLRLLKEINNIYKNMEFDFNGKNYHLTEKIFTKGIDAIVDKEIDSLNYAKKVWISEINKGDNNGKEKVSRNNRTEEEREYGEEVDNYFQF
jgi:hypothetical protein